MNSANLQPLKGFRDFLPEESLKRQFVLDKIRNIFNLFGFSPLETPALEYKSLLAGKMGAEAEKLMYFFNDLGGREVGLRYDQTVPTARILATYQNEIPSPWRRYQIQTVWRADKPQKGRYRELLQCDADIYGSVSSVADAEIMALGYHIFKLLGFSGIKLFVNDRNILFEIMNYCQIPEDKQLSIIQSIDKLDRKSKNEISLELKEKGMDDKNIKHLFNHIDTAKPTPRLNEVIQTSKNLGIDEKDIIFQSGLARGLDYYTGTIFEIKIAGYEAGSVLGGGRYDNLISQLSGINTPAVGFAIGFDRTVEAMEQFQLIPEINKFPTTLVSIFNPELTQVSASVASNLRQNGISCELYCDNQAKLDKQLKYADKKKVRWFIVIGPDEYKNNTVVIKDLSTGHQEEVKLSDIMNKIT